MDSSSPRVRSLRATPVNVPLARPHPTAGGVAACPQAHWLEYQDWAAPILEQPLEVRDGVAVPQMEAGCGLAWNKDAVERYRLR